MPDDFYCAYPDWLPASCHFDFSSFASELCLCSECPWYMEDVSLLEV